MKLSRRLVLRGIGGAVLGLPFLESIGRTAPARADAESSFAIFLRQGNGVAAAQNTEVGMEPERFWANANGYSGSLQINARGITGVAAAQEGKLTVFVNGDGATVPSSAPFDQPTSQ